MVTGDTTSTALRWIPLLPLLAAAVHGVMIGLVRRSAPRWFVNTLSCGSVGLSFLLSCYAFFRLVYLKDDYRWLTDSLYTWFGAGVGDTRFSAEMGLRLDPLSSIMTLVVTGVGFLIHLYSIGYMADDHREDRGYQREIIVHWTPDTARAYQLCHVFLHELGHHIDRMSTRSQRDNAPRGEEWAEQYAWAYEVMVLERYFEEFGLPATL